MRVLHNARTNCAATVRSCCSFWRMLFSVSFITDFSCMQNGDHHMHPCGCSLHPGSLPAEAPAADLAALRALWRLCSKTVAALDTKCSLVSPRRGTATTSEVHLRAKPTRTRTLREEQRGWWNGQPTCRGVSGAVARPHSRVSTQPRVLTQPHTQPNTCQVKRVSKT